MMTVADTARSKAEAGTFDPAQEDRRPAVILLHRWPVIVSYLRRYGTHFLSEETFRNAEQAVLA
jgi:hypothetical protein